MVKKGLLNYLGTIGAVVIGKICPVCYPAIGAFLTAMGLGFALRAAVMKSLLILFLGTGVLGLLRSGRGHGNFWPLWIALASALVVYTGRYIRPHENLFYAGAAGLLVAVAMDIRARSGRARCGSCNMSGVRRR